MSEEKNLWGSIEEYVYEIHLDYSRQKYFSAWPVIAGVRLSSCTRLEKVDTEKGKITVRPNSLSSRSLLLMEKKRIIEDWNRMFPSFPIKEVVIAKGY